jgi:predicted DNA-binding protein YlxM (UPF0122 family)
MIGKIDLDSRIDEISRLIEEKRTTREISLVLNISRSTLINFLKLHPEFKIKLRVNYDSRRSEVARKNWSDPNHRRKWEEARRARRSPERIARKNKETAKEKWDKRLPEIERLITNGLTLPQIAKELNVDYGNIVDRIKRYPNYSSLKEGLYRNWLGKVKSNEYRTKRSTQTKLFYQKHPEVLQKMKEKTLMMFRNEAFKNNFLDAMSRMWANQDYRNKMSKVSSEKFNQKPELREKARKHFKDLWADPAFYGKVFSLENRTQASKRMKLLWQDFEYRKKVMTNCKPIADFWNWLSDFSEEKQTKILVAIHKKKWKRKF